ncbi:MAG: CoA transferase, partial [Pseudobutyrivibrio sp.]|nr:CoA transferase [Pseudobutyrivibrio sp.]
FKQNRYNSATRVDNALNGSFYKYKTRDGKYFSAHVYYESQKKRMMELLKIKKDPDKFQLMSLPIDKVLTANAIKEWDALDLEEATFEKAQDCGCVLRDRTEWEKSEVGAAVCAMPLSKIVKVSDAPIRKLDGDVKRGPLTGLKVVDLTHIIAGPACTRLLAEQGAEVTLIRRGALKNQEQAMLELDGWAGKQTIDLDFNVASQLEKAKELIKNADIVVSSYQQGALDRFGLSKEDIRALNPNVIYGEMMCFSDTVWRTRPGWAPLAEDITGLSIRNGSKENPVNLNGVPLDYIPGFIMAGGILKALRLSLTEGGAYDVKGSLTRGGYWLHECTDLCIAKRPQYTSAAVEPIEAYSWKNILTPDIETSCGQVRFPLPATYQSGTDPGVRLNNMKFK